MKQLLSVLCGLVLLAAASQTHLLAQQTTFTYEGYFTDANAPAQGPYDFRFTLHDSPANGLTVAGPVLAEDVPVQQGRFQLPLNFGDAVFNGEARWLEIAIRPGADNGDFIILEPRQHLTPTPYAIHAYRAAGVDAGAINGAAIAPGSLDASHLFVPAGPQPGQVLSYDGGNLLWTAPGPAGDSVFSLNGSSAYYLNGNVGLGTPAPVGKLEVVAQDALRLVGYQPFMTIYDDSTGYARARVQSVGGDLNLFTESYLNGSNPFAFLKLANNGNVGIGTPTPLGKLEVIGQDALRLVGYQPFLTLYDDSAGYARGRIQTAGGAIVLEPESYVSGSDPNAHVTLSDNGNLSVKNITIRGGADLAEPFQLSGDGISKGAVVIIDEDHPGQLKISSKAYDTRVAGIISGANGVNPGISLHQEGLLEGSQNVALTGRVYVQADASFGTIRPGDLLTTSDTPGHAMKVSDRSRAHGAILGKAMNTLSEGRGMVLVLVTLH